MKGKGHRVTARTIAAGADIEESRPLTTDPWDNAILMEDEKIFGDTAGDEQGVCPCTTGRGVRCILYHQQDQEGTISGRTLPDADGKPDGDLFV